MAPLPDGPAQAGRPFGARWLPLAALLLGCSALVAAPSTTTPPPEYVQAVEFPYYLYPRALWERELVWLKAIGVRTVAFSIPWNWHQLPSGDCDFTGATSPRRDLLAFIRILRHLGLRAWVRPLPPVPGWLNNGWPPGISAAAAGPEARAQRAWLKQLDGVLGTQTASHGGPIAYVEGRGLAIDAATPPMPVTVISADDASALIRSRQAMASPHGALLWTNVEDALYPAGWEPAEASLLRKGAVGLSGDESPNTASLRRDASLLRNWGRLFPTLHPVAMPKPGAGRWPAGVTAVELASLAASAVSITNHSQKLFHDDVRVREPGSNRMLAIPAAAVPPGESLWLPFNVSIGPGGLCVDCAHFSAAEHIVYATAELLSIEFENGILSMEFAAPEAGEVVLQLARKPVGPYLAAGKPTEFDWDDRTLRARLSIPAGKAAGNLVRVGIAVEEPETSAFFDDAKRLIAGRKNLISTTYSSPEVAARSRLRLPENYSATPIVKSPNQIDYEISVPADAVHGDWVALALEADGVPLGRARLQVLRPASIRLMEAIQIHFGQQTELPPDPPTAIIDPRAGANLEVSIRNNWPGIETFQLEFGGDGLDFFPSKTEISIGAMDERRVSLRVFAREGSPEAAGALCDWHLRISRGADLDSPMRVVLLPRGRTVAWTADLDGDGSPEWVLESQKVRAVFSTQDGGRWMEFNWKDTNLNFLPDQGALASQGAVEVRASGDGLEFTGKGWKRTVRLSDTTLSIEQNTALPPDGLVSDKRANVSLSITRPSPTTATYTLQ